MNCALYDTWRTGAQSDFTPFYNNSLLSEARGSLHIVDYEVETEVDLHVLCQCKKYETYRKIMYDNVNTM